jgi:hypothetical protein
MPEPVYRAEGGLAPATADGPASAAALPLPSLRWPVSTSSLLVALVTVTAALIAAATANSLGQGGGLALVGRDPEPARPVAAARPVAREVAEPVLEPILVGPMPTEIEPAALPTSSTASPTSAEPVTDQASLDAANRVSRLGAVTVLAELGGGTPATAPKQLIVGPSGIYVLDPYAGTLYLIDPTGKPSTPLLSRGWTIAREKVTDLIGATWRGDTLVVMDRARAYTLDGPNGTWRVAPLAAANLGLGVHPLASFDGSLYVLDNASRQVLKFAQGAYGRAPQAWLRPAEKVDLSGAVDIAIDGRIYVLTASGQIVHLFRGSLERTLTVDVMPPIQAPAALIRSTSGGVFYLAESGGRILKLSRDGHLLRQFRLPEGSTDLNGLSDLWVDEAGRVLYAVAGNRVVRVDLPPPTSPSRGRSLPL